jgi:hypothetical protein
MKDQVVECVPNFSEGRDARRVEAIIAAMRMDGVRLLDWSMDADHNRSVITIAGDPALVLESALRGVGKAVELIDLTSQEGLHPRIGAADVIPFVPVTGIKLEQCVMLARQAGLEIWRRFGVPVYFYEAAASRPDRANLDDVRRGQFEGLRDAVRKEAAPDRRSLRRRCAKVPRHLLSLSRHYGRRCGASHRSRSSRQLWRSAGRKSNGPPGSWARTTVHEHHGLQGDPSFAGVQHGLPAGRET